MLLALSSPNPILCVDTCAILDILRDPRRESVRTNDQSASLALLGHAEADRLDVYVTELVRMEFADHVDEVQREAEAGLASLSDDVAKIDALAALHGSSGRTDVSHWNGHPGRCRQIADRWMKVGRDAVQSDDAVSRAVTRVLQGRAPSRRGKDSTKDCIILETYLEHVRNARRGGLTASVAFVSSNVRDYATSAARLSQDIASDFGALLVSYAPNMAAAKALLSL